MCGIAGSVSWSCCNDEAAVQAMTEALRHRGPDAGKVVVRGRATLGHRRLSVIDTDARANQPMGLDSHGLWVVFNGEIYNYRTIRSELEGLGFTFQTSGDTEVLLKAWAAWGERALDRFNGMFAFALWDERCNELVLARDRLGKKPLFYHLDADGLVFASELGALLTNPRVPDSIDPMAVGHFLSHNYVPTERCMVAGIAKLAPGHWLRVTPGGAHAPRSYWDLAGVFRAKATYRSVDEAAEEFNALLDDAVRLRMVSDVPLGAFLSGGLDSAAVVASMGHAADPSRIRTFTIGFREKGYSEVDEARVTAQALGVDHAESLVDACQASDLAKVLTAVDEPCADTSVIPFYSLAEFARRSVTVCLSGDGADELFAGYVTYQADRLHSVLRHVPAPLRQAALWSVHALPTTFDKVGLDYKLRQFAAGLALSPARAHVYWRTIFSEPDKAALLRDDVRAAVVAEDPFAPFARHFDAVAGCHYLDQASYVDIKTWMVESILVKVDRTTMAHGLEARAPFLDHRLVEFAAALPVAWKLNGLTKKFIMRRALAKRLPDTVLRRPKKGFNAPVAHWIDGQMAELGRDLTLGNPLLCEWVQTAEVERLWREHAERRRDNGFRLFGLMCLGAWFERTRVTASRRRSAESFVR